MPASLLTGSAATKASTSSLLTFLGKRFQEDKAYQLPAHASGCIEPGRAHHLLRCEAICTPRPTGR